METHEHKPSMRETVLRAIAVLGLIAVLLLGAWGIIQLAVAIPSLFSNVGGNFSGIFSVGDKKEAVTVSSIANLASGQTLQVSWKHDNKDGEYSYALSFACQSGLSVKAPLPTGAYQTIECDRSFNYVGATERMTLIPTVTGSKTLPLTVTVTATKLSTGAVTAQGSATTNVALKVATTPSSITSNSNNTSSTYVPAAPAQTLYGLGDLAVNINSVTPAGNGLTAVKFTVANVGTNSIAGGWIFNANLPINGSYIYTSAPQRQLFPGDKIVYTLTFSNSYGYNTYDPNGWGYSGQGSYTCGTYYPCYPNQQPPYGYNYGAGPVSIMIDPQNAAYESNEYNNTAYTQAY